MKGSPVAVIGSGGFLEVSTNQGNAAEILGIHVSERIIVESGES